MSQRKTGIILNYLGEAVKIITAFVYTPLMLRLLGQSEYGLYQLASSTVAYLSLLSLGFGSAYVRYHSRYMAKNDTKGVAKLNGMFMLVFCGMSALCLVCGGGMIVNIEKLFDGGLAIDELNKAKILMSILVISMAVTFPNSIFSCYVTAHEQFIFQKVLNIAQSVLNPFITLPLLLLGYGSVAVVTFSAVLTGGAFCANAWFCIRKLKMQFSFRGLQISLLKELWVFTFYIFLNQIIDQVNWGVGKLLLGRMSGTVAVAIYGVAGQLNSLYIQMSTSVSSVFAPQVNRLVAEEDDNTSLTKLMIKVGRIQFMILALVISGFVFFGKQFICLWAGAEYAQSYAVALLLMLPVTIPLIQNLGIEIQRAKNKHKARSVVCLCLAIVNVVVSIVLIPVLGSAGAAVGTAISLCLGNGLFMNWYYQKYIGLDMKAFWGNIVKTMPALVAPCIVGITLTLLIPGSGWGRLLVMILVYTLVYCVSMLLLGMNADEKKLVKSFLKSLHIVR